MHFNPNDYSIVFLSYDEPNCEENYSHLLTIRPDALRIHGIKGSDTAHKACAEIAKTDRFIIVDGDNRVRSNFLNISIDIEYSKSNVISFSGYNIVNSTQYGNGGVKCWHKDTIKNMNTHENSLDNKFTIDFDLRNYLELNTVGSDLYINSSPLQAWRSGFREVFKLSLNKNIDWRNRDRLYRWMHLGTDVENGLYCIHGARYAYFLINHEQWDNYTSIRDFDFLNIMFNTVTKNFDQNELLSECNRLGNIIRIENVFDNNKSQKYKDAIASPTRSPERFINNKQPVLHDIVFIHNNEPNANNNFENVKKRFPKVKLVTGQKGIHNAHKIAATLCSTDYFWVIDGDNIIVDDFDFTQHDVEFYEEPTVRVYRAINPVNNLLYGHGAVKLLPRLATLSTRTDNIDMTTNISTVYKPVNIISNIHKFDVDSFSSWRTAFRECVKLSSQIIDRQISKETLSRLEIWCTVAENTEYKKEIIQGALAGKNYGENNKDNKSKLQLINDYEWLRKIYDEQFQRHAI